MINTGFHSYCVILAEFTAILLPVLMVFEKDWRFSLAKTAGILLGYLFFICLSTQFLPDTLWGSRPTSILWACLTMYTHILMGLLLIKADLQLIIYSLFLYKNFANAADHICDVLLGMAAARSWFCPSSIQMLLRVTLLSGIAYGGYRLTSAYMKEALKYTRTLTIWKSLSTIPILFFITSCLASLDHTAEELMIRSPDLLFFAFFWLCCMYTVHYVILHTLAGLSQSYAIREQYRTSRLLASAQTSQMAHLQSTLEEMQKARHDFRHHAITVRGMIAMKKHEAALEYIDNYIGNTISAAPVSYCSNLSSNTILNHYLELARQKSILVSTNISLPESLPLPEIDFCTILGNLLSNALESCERQTSGQPSITVNIAQTGRSMLTLSIRNTYTHAIHFQDGRFLSSKHEDTGIGTASVQYLADKYHGVLRYRYENGIFEASLLLNPNMDMPDS